MIIALLLSLAATTLSGMTLLAVEEGQGPLAGEILESVHSAFTYLTLALVALHILGVLASSFSHRENLVRAMFTGQKKTSG